MAVSGTYSFAPNLGSLALVAFSRIGVKRSEVLAEHMQNAYMETNLMQADWGADGITWWTVELIQQPLTQGVATYSVPSNVVSVLDVYINNGFENRIITSFSRTDFASLAEPQEQGFPTVFWYDRALAPTLTLWPVPDGSTVYSMDYYVYTQIMDADFRQGGNAAIPYWWQDALVADLAHRLSRHHAPALEAQRKADKDEAYARACKQVEPSAIYIQPALSNYFRP